MSSYLLPLQVEGTCSSHQESLHSYYFRLAGLHQVSAGQLTRMLNEHQSSLGLGHLNIPNCLIYSSSGNRLFSYHERVRSLVKCLEIATGIQHLSRSTLLPIAAAISSQCIGSLRPARAWCGNCLEEDVKQGRPAYDRLVWSLKPIERCEIHKLALQMACEQCGEAQRVPHASGDMTLCYRCESSLITPPRTSDVVSTPSFGEMDCLDLIKAISKGELDAIGPLPIDVFESHLVRFLPDLARVVHSLAERSSVQRDAKECSRPSLPTLLKKAHVAGCSVTSMLSQPMMAAASSGQCIRDHSFLPKTPHPRQTFEVETYVHEILSEMLDAPDDLELPGLERISQELGVSPGYIRYRFPNIVQRWLSRRRAHTAKETGRKHRACIEEINLLLSKNSTFSSAKELERHLSGVAGCSIHVARRAMLSRKLPISRAPYS